MQFAQSDRQHQIAQDFGQLFTAELAPALRRAAARPIGAEPAPDVRRRVWQAMQEKGAVRMALPASHGGEDAGLAETTVVAALTGAALFPTPLPDTLLAADLLHRLNKPHLLDHLAAGATVAVAARDRGDQSFTTPTRLKAQLPPDDQGLVRRFVPFAAEVDEFLLVATTPDALVCALIPRDAPGITPARNEDIAWGELHTVTFDHTPRDWIDVPQDAWAAAVAAARIRHAAYLTGMAQAALDLTVAYARDRRQFGRPIGRFQSLAFRLAAAATDVEASKLLVDHAAWRADTGADPTMASLETIANAGDLALKVAAEAVQIHGAVGMTDDCDAQLFYRRAAVDAIFMGTPTQHRREAAPHLVDNPAATPACLQRAP